MDFKLKSKFWSGKIYHQFESICQDVDEFVSKDTVKFVENQVQNVGVTVKKFYSNVVQDILPHSGDIVKPKSQVVNGEQVDMWGHASVTGISTNSSCINKNQLILDQDSMCTLRDSDASLPIEFDNVVHFSKPPCIAASPIAETCLLLGKHGDASIQTGEDSGVEDNEARDSIPVTANSNFNSEQIFGMSNEDPKDSTVTLSSSPAFSAHEEGIRTIKGVISGISDDDHKNSVPTPSSSPAFSADEEGLTTIKKEGRAFNHKKGNKSFSDDAESFSGIASTDGLFQSNLPMVEGQCSHGDGSLSSPSVASTHKVNEDNIMLMDSPVPSACDATGRALEKYKTPSDSFSTKDESFVVSISVHSSEDVFSCSSCDEKEEMGNIPFTPPKSSSIVESTSADFIEKTENILPSHSESDNGAYNLSIPSITSTDQTSAEDLLPASVILKPNDNPFQADKSECVVGSSGSCDEQNYKDDHPEIVISPSKSANAYESDYLDMETVDLSPDVRHDVRSVVPNSNFVRAASHGRRDFRYYKKLIQDAFTSRKRLSKEYEHLAILYGGIDVESNHHFKPSCVPVFPNTAVHAVKTESSQETCDTEWELL